MLEAAEIDANTSGAPLPKASKVTPANDYESRRCFEILARTGDK
jgi:hypothetical protein